ISEQELTLAANGELTSTRAAAVSRHIEACEECRSRLSDLEASLGEYFDAYHEALDPRVPEWGPAQNSLSQRLEADSKSRGPRFDTLRTAIIVGAIAAGVAGIAVLQQFT